MIAEVIEKLDESQKNYEQLMAKVAFMDMNMKKDHKKNADNEAAGIMTSLSGFNPKDVVKPAPYDDDKEFLQWSELFSAYMMSIDKQWKTILETLQDVELPVLKKERCEKLQKEELKMTSDICTDANHALYINLLAFTQGDVRSRVTSNGKELAFESYRHLYHKGRDATKANIVLMQSSVLSPKAASKVADIEARLNEWKLNQR